MRGLRIVVSVGLALGLAGCASARSASDEDCAALGDRFVKLYMAELTEDSLALGPEVLDAAAAKGREEVVAQCKVKSTPKATVQRCLEAKTMAEFRSC